MAFVVEDGTGLVNANSYVSVAAADAYWLDRHNAPWAAATNNDKETALLDASLFLDNSYRWRGSRSVWTQSLHWPRYITWDGDLKQEINTVVPQRIKDAQCILALESLTNGSLLASLDRGGMIASEAVGSLTISYFQGAPGNRTYPMVSLMLHDLINGMTQGGLAMDAVRG